MAEIIYAHEQDGQNLLSFNTTGIQLMPERFLTFHDCFR